MCLLDGIVERGGSILARFGEIGGRWRILREGETAVGLEEALEYW